MSLIINIDADGVLYDYSGEFWRMAEKRYGQKFPPSTEWGQHLVMGIDEEEYWDFFHDCAVNGVFRNGKAIPGGIEAIREWYKKDYRLRIVTHKSLRRDVSTFHAQTDMIYWLHTQGILNKVEVFFPKGQYDKQGIPADVVVDDKPDLKWAQDGAINILFDQPWNEAEDVASAERFIHPLVSSSHSHNIEPHIYRAKGWEEVQVIVQRAEERKRNEVLYH